MKILMVCLGNICRSPLADALLQEKVNKRGLNHIVDSAGTCDNHIGQSPDSRMTATAESFDLSINHLRARQFEVSDFDNFDLIYAMDNSNFQNILSLARNEEDERKVKMILDESHPKMQLEVPDPYFGGERGFIEVYNLLDNATDCIMNKLIKE
ncbi:MAG: low molecular weight phosphotyrosine protein phosphatase [Fluviicola sp.]|nr:low molecular weight phosphotyrosine protein phosphatase [Fluviicola sp.]